MENKSIPNALKALYNDTNNSNLVDTAKNAMIKLIELLLTYYGNRIEEITNGLDSSEVKRQKFDLLTSQMTDYIVAINDTIKGKHNPYSVVSFIHREINYDEKKGRFKRKRLI